MAKVSSRVVINRQALGEVGMAVAAGVEDVVRAVVENATPPDATPFGEGLVTRGGWLVYAGSKKVGGGSLDGKQPAKPRELRVRGQLGITAIAGFGFPGRFQETGTVNHPAQPFVWPAWNAIEGDVAGIMAPSVRAYLAASRVAGGAIRR